MPKPAKSYAPRIHGVAMDALKAVAETLEGAGLGPFRATPDGWEYEPGRPGVRALRLTWEQRKKFMGGVYRVALEAEIDCPDLDEAAGKLRLHYAGMLLKGAPELRPEKRPGSGVAGDSENDPLAAVLNADPQLTRLLSLQDIEEMTIAPGPEPGSLKLRLVPIGGSFVWMLVPPLKYAVRLPASHARAMADTVARLADLVADDEPAGPHFTAADSESRPHAHPGGEHP